MTYYRFQKIAFVIILTIVISSAQANSDVDNPNSDVDNSNSDVDMLVRKLLHLARRQYGEFGKINLLHNKALIGIRQSNIIES